jgi:protoheme IX farnesyltransferase
MELIADARASWRDYLELCKPKVVLLMILTAVVGMFLATPGLVPWDVLLFGNLGIALCAGSAAAINHVVDQRIDAVMARTRNRPIAQGRVSTAQAITFAVLIGLPPRVTVPASAARMPLSIEMVVVLPAPFGPSNP